MACELLRRTVRYSTLASKLGEQVAAGTKEITRVRFEKDSGKT